MTLILAEIGVTVMYLLFGWLACSIAGGWLAERKGYPEKYGLAAGMLLFVLGPLIWLAWPAREGSDWRVLGPLGRKQPPK